MKRVCYTLRDGHTSSAQCSLLLSVLRWTADSLLVFCALALQSCSVCCIVLHCIVLYCTKIYCMALNSMHAGPSYRTDFEVGFGDHAATMT